jgi:ribosomal protein S8
MGYNKTRNFIFVTCNGEIILQHILPKRPEKDFYPALSLDQSGQGVTPNFGTKKFEFDLEKYNKMFENDDPIETTSSSKSKSTSKSKKRRIDQTEDDSTDNESTDENFADSDILNLSRNMDLLDPVFSQDDNIEVYKFKSKAHAKAGPCDLHILVTGFEEEKKKNKDKIKAANTTTDKDKENQKTINIDTTDETTTQPAQKLIIPVHKAFITGNIRYFQRMFDTQSGWSENKKNGLGLTRTNSHGSQIKNSQTTNQKTLEKIATIEITSITEDLKMLGHYINSVYDQKLNLSLETCAKYFKIADYFKDETYIAPIKSYCRGNIGVSNFIDLLKFGDKFIPAIEKYFDEEFIDENENCYNEEILDKIEIELTYLNQSNFIKLMNLISKRNLVKDVDLDTTSTTTASNSKSENLNNENNKNTFDSKYLELLKIYTETHPSLTTKIVLALDYTHVPKDVKFGITQTFFSKIDNKSFTKLMDSLMK